MFGGRLGRGKGLLAEVLTHTHTRKRSIEGTITYIHISIEIQKDDPDFVLCETISGLERAPTLFGRNMFFNLLVFNLFHNFVFESTMFRSL